MGPGLQREFGREIRRLCESERVDLLHDHGQWLATNRAAAVVGRSLKIPRVVSPRGMLSPWSLSRRRWSKRVLWRLHARRDLETAAAIHATSELEQGELRGLGLRAPIIVAPNGIEFPGEIVAKRQSPRELLFLSRIHPKKGLLDLVEAWRRLRPAGWRVVIAGPDEGGHRAELEAAIKKAELQTDFEFTGPVEGDRKWDLYGRASLFVLPSYSENFGLVVAEALASGTPVVTTRVTPWSLLRDERCGWWVDPGPDALENALREALVSEDLPGMGDRARRVVRERFAWEPIGQMMAAAYRNLVESEVGSPADVAR
jgi:glycosyltransferase involved in cell wall biosynthesis